MIFANRTITVNNGKSKINEPIVAYRGDYELEVRFIILNSTFNFIETENAAFGQLAVLTPYGGNIFSSVAECNEGAVSFLLSKDMLDQIEEVGLYSFQIRLFDQDKQSRISIPPVEHGIEIREPIASEDHDNTVNNAIVGYSIARVVNPKEGIIGDTFDEYGNYKKTKWETGDRISEVKLNKIEDAIDKINDNEIDNVEALNKRITNNFNVLNSTKADILDVNHKVWGMSNMGQDVKEAMTGGSVAVVGVNTVLNENIVDGQITHRKFAKSFLYSDVKIEPNTDHSTINTLLPTGYMYVLPGSHGMPVDISDRTCLLENITCENRFVYQKIHEYSNPNKYYVRFFDNSTGNYSEWSYFNMDNVLLDLDVEAKQNLLDKRLFVIGGLTSDGTVDPYVTDNYCSGYIPVHPNKKYYRRIANLVVVTFYDADKKFIDRPTIQQGAVIIPPQNAYYMRYTDEKEAMNGEVISEFPIYKYTEYQPNITYYIKGCTTTPEPRSVNHNILADNYLSSNNFLSNSFDLNTLSSDGIFVCNDVINKPKEITGSSFLINKGFKPDKADINKGVRWVLQEIFDYTDINKHFYRKLDLDSPEHSTNWIDANEIVDGQITHRKFAKSFLYSDVKIEPNTDHSTINTLLPTGYMYVLPGSHGMPVDISDRTCLLENITCENRFVYQKIHEYSNPNKYYVRFFDNSTGNYSEWSYFNMDNVLLDLDVEAKQNLLDKRLFVIGGLTSDGTVDPYVTDNYCSGYIPVHPNKKYYRRIANLVVVTFYDADKKFIDRPTIQQGAVIIPPQNAYYMRYTDEKEAMNGEVISEFPIYKYTEYQPNITYYIKGCTTTPEPRSVNHNILADNYLSSNNFLSNSFDLNTLSSDGIFVCNDVINKPKEITGSSFLINKGFKPDKADINKGVRWVLQEIFDYTDINKHFYRKLDLDSPEHSTNWIDANESVYTSKFKGKKLVTFGDSITEGVGASNSSKNYPSLLSSKYGLIVENKGISGATWAKYNDGYDDISVLTQISNTNFSDVDYVTIFAGTNDFGRGVRPIGNNDDAVENTMKGAINLAIKQIIQAKPTIRIAIITPMWRQRLASGDNKDSDFNTFQGKYLKEYVDAVKEMADYNHIPCLDFYHNCLINKYNYQTFLNDGLHPNDTGYELLADMIHAFLEKTY